LEPEQKKSSDTADRSKVKLNKPLLIYLFFLIISVSLWYLNALSKDYTTEVDCLVTYQSFPKGKALVSDLPEKLSLKVKGLGFSILKYKLTSYYHPITLPVSNFRLDIIRRENRYEYFLLTRYAKDEIASQLSSDIQLISIRPDTLQFLFADVVEKKVPVVPALNLQFETQYLQHGKLMVMPDSIVASGPQVMIDSLQFVNTRLVTIKDIKDTLIKEVELQPLKNITYSKPKVWFVLPVEKYTEMALSIPIEGENVPDGYRVKTFPGYITLSCWVGIADYDKITPFMFRATVDYNALIGNPRNKAKIKLVKAPASVQNVRFNPKSTEYIIEK
jgi:hypothetical protein